MRSLQLGISLFALAALLCAAPAAAETEEQGHLELKMTVEKEVTVTNEDGVTEVKLVEPALVVPGEEVVYTIHYRNVGSEKATGVVITNPVPEHMIYTSLSASGVDTHIEFSVDGTAFGNPKELTVTSEDGQQRPASNEDYTHIRWVRATPLAPGEGGAVHYRARLE